MYMFVKFVEYVECIRTAIVQYRAFSSAVSPVARVSNWQSWREGSNGQQGTKKIQKGMIYHITNQHRPTHSEKSWPLCQYVIWTTQWVSHNLEARSKELKKEFWEQCPEALIGDLPDLKTLPTYQSIAIRKLQAYQIWTVAIPAKVPWFTEIRVRLFFLKFESVNCKGVSVPVSIELLDSLQQEGPAKFGGLNQE